jgi:hypothetical protein
MTFMISYQLMIVDSLCFRTMVILLLPQLVLQSVDAMMIVALGVLMITAALIVGMMIVDPAVMIVVIVDTLVVEMMTMDLLEAAMMIVTIYVNVMMTGNVIAVMVAMLPAVIVMIAAPMVTGVIVQLLHMCGYYLPDLQDSWPSCK